MDRMRAAAGSKPKPPPADKISFRCGCVKVTKEFVTQDCPTCRRKKKQTVNATRRKWKHSKYLNMGGAEPGRLPAGAVKALTWDGAKWAGVMTVPGYPPVEATADSEAELVRLLHRGYVECRRAQGGA